jgi:hypothetical protein
MVISLKVIGPLFDCGCRSFPAALPIVAIPLFKISPVPNPLFVNILFNQLIFSKIIIWKNFLQMVERVQIFILLQKIRKL